MMDRVFETAPLHFETSIRLWVKCEDRRVGIGAAQRLDIGRREKMPYAAFKELAVKRVDDIK